MKVFYLQELPRCYVLKTDRYMDSGDFKEFCKDFKTLYIFYDKEVNGWKIPKSKGWETYQYLTKKFKLTVETQGFEFPTHPSLPQETVFSRKIVFDPEVIRVKLFNYQLEDISWAVKRTRAYIASDPGVGKTIEGIGILSFLKKYGYIDSAVIIVKGILTHHWIREIGEFSSIFGPENIFSVNNGNKHELFDRSGIRDKSILLIPNHILKDVVGSYSVFDLKRLWGKSSTALLVDEVHEFKSAKAKKTEALKLFLPSCDHRYFLSATPAINGFADWYTQMRMLDESIIPMSEEAFKLDIARTIGNKWDAFAVNSYDREKVMHYLDKFKLWVIKRLKSELPEVKTKQFSKPIYFEMSQKHQNIYKLIRQIYIEKKQISPEGVTFKEINNKFPYLCLAIDNPFLLVDRIKEDESGLFQPLTQQLASWKHEDNNKTLYLDEYLRQKIKGEKEKVILFDIHPVTLNQFFERYKEYDPLMIHGRTGDDNDSRQRKVDLFNDKNSKHKLFLLNPSTGGTGLNLHKACRTIIYNTCPYDGVLTKQSIDRTWRVTSEYDSLVEFLTYDKTIDEQRVNTNIERMKFNDTSFKDNVYIKV